MNLNIEFKNGEQFLAFSPYIYVLANPLKYIDPMGLYPAISECSSQRDCDIHQVVRFIVDRIREDSTSTEIQAIRELNKSNHYKEIQEAYQQMSGWQKVLAGDYLQMAFDADVTAYDVALAKFGCLVADARSRPFCGQWDYKREIGNRADSGYNAQKIDFCTIGINEDVIFYYDIWANMHFGYLGMVGGFSENMLLTGGDVEQTVSNPGSGRDDPSDGDLMTPISPPLNSFS